jgi:hypothetical protein
MTSVVTDEQGLDGNEGSGAVGLVIDADGHCNEPWRELGAWMPPEFADKGPIDYGGRVVWEDHVLLRATGHDPGPRGPFADSVNIDGRPGEEDPVQRLRDMDYEGIDVAVIFGAVVLFAVNGLEDRGLAAAACRGFNEWLLEYMSVDPMRLKGVGLIPCQDPTRAGEEIEWLSARRAGGMVSAMLPTNVYGINLGDRRFDPIYEAAQSVRMPLSVHPQTMHWGRHGVSGIAGAGCERLEKYSYVHALSFPVEAMIALMHQIGEGVFDRYPTLKVGYMEGGCGWLPFWAGRLDEHFEKLRPQWPDCERSPSEIIRSGQVAVTCEPEEAEIPYVLESLGSDMVMYASDYAHWDSECPRSVEKIVAVEGMTDSSLRSVLGMNAMNWFGLSPSEVPSQSVWTNGRQRDRTWA